MSTTICTCIALTADLLYISIDLYTLVSIISATAILILGFCMLGAATPPEPEFRSYHISRRILAVAYIVLAIMSTSELFLSTDSLKVTKLTLAIVISIAMLQALLFTSSLITLINIRFFTLKRIGLHLLPILISIVVLSVTLFCEDEELFYISLIMAAAVYVMLLVYYVLLFRQEYLDYKRRMQNYFSGNEEKRLQWVNHLFYTALCIGISVLPGIFFHVSYYTIFMIIYTFFYAYFAIKYINYATIFRDLLPAIKITEQQPPTPSAPSYCHNKEYLEKELDQWIAKKSFVNPHITLEKLAAELNTNHTYLSEFINKEKKQTFKLWINTLRIEEAQKLLLEDTTMPIALVAEKTGIISKATFFRQFTNITGMSPGKYREKMQNNK